MSGDIKDDIIAAIAKTEDANMKAVLLLLLSVVGDIGDKIDAMMRDDKRVRDAVLNGHEPVHHAHHEWVTRKMREEEQEAEADKESKRKIRDEIFLGVLKWAAIVVLTASGWVFR